MVVPFHTTKAIYCFFAGGQSFISGISSSSGGNDHPTPHGYVSPSLKSSFGMLIHEQFSLYALVMLTLLGFCADFMQPLRMNLR